LSSPWSPEPSHRSVLRRKLLVIATDPPDPQATFQHGTKKEVLCWLWWCILLIQVLRSLRQEDSEFEASLGYIWSSKPAFFYSETKLKKKPLERERERERKGRKEESKRFN
jgi:hypothetical protein